MNRAEWFESKCLWLKRLGLAAGVGVAILIVGVAAELIPLSFVGMLLLMPVFFWLAFIPILHWKDRYVGNASNVWGAFLVFETSSWSKLIYWFVHVIPDWKRSGQYADVP